MSEVNPDKPCPFCGNTAVQTTVDDGYHWSSCPKCSATGPTEFLRSDEDSPGWNARPDFDRVTAERDAALLELSEIKETLERWHELNLQREARVDALQQCLTAADERADVLEGLLRDGKDVMSGIWDTSYDHEAGDALSALDLMERIDAALKPAESDGDSSTCTWQHVDDRDIWDTGCGTSWAFTDEGPKENGMKFCHACGKTLMVEDSGDDD